MCISVFDRLERSRSLLSLSRGKRRSARRRRRFRAEWHGEAKRVKFPAGCSNWACQQRSPVFTSFYVLTVRPATGGLAPKRKPARQRSDRPLRFICARRLTKRGNCFNCWEGLLTKELFLSTIYLDRAAHVFGPAPGADFQYEASQRSRCGLLSRFHRRK